MSKKFLRLFSCIGVIYIIYQLSGFEVVYAYTENFFEESGVELEPSLAALLAGTQYDISGAPWTFYTNMYQKLYKLIYY